MRCGNPRRHLTDAKDWRSCFLSGHAIEIVGFAWSVSAISCGWRLKDQFAAEIPRREDRHGSIRCPDRYNLA